MEKNGTAGCVTKVLLIGNCLRSKNYAFDHKVIIPCVTASVLFAYQKFEIQMILETEK
jgi:hypothetical protein